MKEVRLGRADRAAEDRARSARAADRDRRAGSSVARCFGGSRAIAARTSAARSCRISDCSAGSARWSTCRSASSVSGRGVFSANRFRQTFTAMRYSQVAERRLPLESLEALVGADERVLRQVGGVLVVRHEAIAELIHGAAVPLDDDVEGVARARRARPRPAPRRRSPPSARVGRLRSLGRAVSLRLESSSQAPLVPPTACSACPILIQLTIPHGASLR